MLIDEKTIKNVPKKEQGLLELLYKDLQEVNSALPSSKRMNIGWQDYHDTYSCERTDPCPDFYGYYTLRFQDDTRETAGIEMTIQDLDNVLCVLHDIYEKE